MKHIKNAKVTAKIQIREGAQIRVLGGTWYLYPPKKKAYPVRTIIYIIKMCLYILLYLYIPHISYIKIHLYSLL